MIYRTYPQDVLRTIFARMRLSNKLWLAARVRNAVMRLLVTLDRSADQRPDARH